MSPSSQSRCAHSSLLTKPSPHARDKGYQLRNLQQLFTASTGSRKRIDSSYGEHLAFYPGPLVLPDDELAHDPDYPPQSFVTWKNEKARNVVSGGQEVVYVAEYPKLDQTVDGIMAAWDVPIITHDDDDDDANDVASSSTPTPPPFQDILVYLQAFFHHMPVKRLNDPLSFTTWDDRTCKPAKRGTTSKSRSKFNPSAIRNPPMTKPPQSIGLSSTSTTITTRIRVRHLPATSTSPYKHQLNLNDVLDHAIAILPTDAYALLLLVSQDLYEDEDDDFCIGRAYGGSRVAVVSGARYQPTLDISSDIDASGLHSWPASHCEAFVEDICAGMTGQKRKRKHKQATGSYPSDANATPQDHSLPLQPLQCAINAHTHSLDHSNPNSASTQTSLYTRRLSLTASHELLHCFGLDHCVYLACAMQGTASVAEDTRQPPYLCPVCENKLAAAIVLRPSHGAKMEETWWELARVQKWKSERREALMEFCEGMGVAFAGLGGWYQGLADMELEKTT